MSMYLGIDALVVQYLADGLEKTNTKQYPKDVILRGIHESLKVRYVGLGFDTEQDLNDVIWLDDFLYHYPNVLRDRLRELAHFVGVKADLITHQLKNAMSKFNKVVSRNSPHRKELWVFRDGQDILAIAGNDRFTLQRLAQIKPSDFKKHYRRYGKLSPGLARFYRPVFNNPNNLFYWDAKRWHRLTNRYTQ